MCLKSHSRVRNAIVVDFPYRRGRTGLYAFVEADGVTESAMLEFIGVGLSGVKIPDHLQITDMLPRDASGAAHRELLHLIALNQIDLIETMVPDEVNRAAIVRIVASRQNLRDLTKI
jgi:acyl-coenzyme A synthetase/AMP-(fatty) acid ligase